MRRRNRKRDAPFAPESSPFDRREFLGAAMAGAAAFSVPTTVTTAGASSAGGLPYAQLGPPTLTEAPDAGAWIELDRGAVAANLQAVRDRAGGRPVMGVVKANAYGHGLVPMARLLAEAGVDALLVIAVDEAIAVRDAGIDVPVLNYGPFDRRAAQELVARRIDQAVYTREAIEGMADAAGRVGGRARIQLVLDTGLGRVGVPFYDPDASAGDSTTTGELFEAALTAGGNPLSITGLITALTEDEAYDRVQLGRYLAARDRAREAGIDVGVQHVASSAAVLAFPESHLDMVRPGITLYGHYPNEQSMSSRPIELVPVLSLRAKVAYVKTLEAGDSIGYHRAWVADRPTKIATLPIGHSEGYPAESVAAEGAVEIHGRACPLVGGVTSNHLEVAVPEDVDVNVGDTATLIAGGAAELAGEGRPPSTSRAGIGETGRQRWQPTAQQVGRWDGAGVYGTLMHLSPLLPRVIV